MQPETLSDALRAAFDRHADKTAVTFLRNGRAEAVRTYRDLEADARRCAHRFAALGVRKGERVVLFLDKGLIFLTAHLALQKLGAIAVPLNPGFKRHELAYLLTDADPRLIVCERERQKVLSGILPDRTLLTVDSSAPYQDWTFLQGAPDDPVQAVAAGDDPALIIYTSGTTGNPKGAVLTQRNLFCDAANVVDVWEIGASDVVCHALPLFHVHGLCFALHTALLSGARVLMLDQFDAPTVLGVLAVGDRSDERRCTVFMAVPAMYTKLIDTLGDRRFDFGHVRLWTSGSAPLLEKDFARIRSVFGKEPVEREGMSETGMNFSNPLNGRRRPGSIGLPMPGVGVRIVDPDTGRDVPAGQIGEIWLQGPAITPGYWRKPAETAATFVDGWFRTGDLGKQEADGYYYLTDRIKHIIITGGENVSAKEVETVINQVDGVAESSVVGIPDPKWGEKVVAAVVPRVGSVLEAEKIRAFCREHLHDWKCPKEIRFLAEMPKNTMGKVLKEEVKKAFGK